MKTFARANRPGAYLRVLEPSEVWAGDPVTVEDRPPGARGDDRAGVSGVHARAGAVPELVEIDGLPDDLRETVAERLLRRR